MTERKKPGPKPKCKECGRKEGEGHYDDCSVGMGVMPRSVPDVVEAMADKALSILAQSYAMRVWNGQSPDVKREEKIRRVKLALEGQNLPFEGVELP